MAPPVDCTKLTSTAAGRKDNNSWNPAIDQPDLTGLFQAAICDLAFNQPVNGRADLQLHYGAVDKRGHRYDTSPIGKL
jgi:hypothetical protein